MKNVLFFFEALAIFSLMGLVILFCYAITLPNNVPTPSVKMDSITYDTCYKIKGLPNWDSCVTVTNLK